MVTLCQLRRLGRDAARRHHQHAHRRTRQLGALARDPQITLRGRITGNVRNYYTVHVTLHDSQGNLCDEGNVTYCMFNKERSQEMGFTACLTEEEAK